MLFSQVVDTSRAIGSTTKRLQKTELLATLLKQLQPDEIETAVALPNFGAPRSRTETLQPDEIETAVAFLSGATRQGRIGVGYAVLRDARTAAAEAATLEIMEVDRALEQIASVQGPGADRNRRDLLNRLFARATENEQQFLTGLLLGEIRQGALEGIMLEALAKAAGISADRIRRAAMMGGGVAAIAGKVLSEGEAGLHGFDVQLFRPVQPMLAQTAEDVNDAIDQLGDAALEYKFDGARVQAHKSGDNVVIYSRQQNDVGAAIPEVVEAVRALPARDLILDGEVLSLDAEGRPQPFQISMRRFGRKLNVGQMLDELPMSPFWFDLLYLNGGSLIDEPQSRRFGELVNLAPASTLVPHVVTANQTQAEDFLHEALARGHEGIMAKSPAAAYAAGARGQSWLKIKKPRTLDLVVLAAEWGNGRRRGLLSNLHLGARDTEQGGFAMLGKTFKGLTDEMLAWQTQQFLQLEIGRDNYTVYLEPKLVVEIAFNEIQASSRYASGLALRFARVKRYRTDKSAADADTFDTVKKLAGVTP